MQREAITIVSNVDGVMTPVAYDVVITRHEDLAISYGHEALDDVMYEIYTSENDLAFYYNKLFTKRIRKALDVMGFIPTLKLIHDWYTCDDTRNGNTRPTLYACEWMMLREQYYEVLIGGDSIETPFI